MTDPNKSSVNQEHLKDENQFLKMKMMLEHGADIKMENIAPPEIENKFLKHVMEWERQRANSSETTVYKKIGSPEHFKQVSEIPEEEMKDRLNEIMEFMRERGISLSVFSPNIPDREIYRFIVEELFDTEVESFQMPGLVNCFFYDDFHPDHKFENMNLATDECIKVIFSKEEFRDITHYSCDSINLNEHESLSKAEITEIVNRFKSKFSEINLQEVVAEECSIEGEACIVKGKYSVELVQNETKTLVKDQWVVKLLFIDTYGFWFINDVKLNGVEL